MAGDIASRARAVRAMTGRSGVSHLVAKSRQVLREEGATGLVHKVRAVTGGGLVANPEVHGPVARPAGSVFPGSLLLVGNRDLEQCFHYRVEQKYEAARSLGLPFLFADSREPQAMRAKVQVAGVLVLYRVAWSRDVGRLITEARRLGVPVLFETDDAVHRRDLAEANPNLATLSPRLRRAVVRGSDLFMRTLRACDHVVASTPALADELVRHVGGRSFVVNNAIDAGMDAVAQSIDSERAEGRWTAAEPGSVTVTYGSGSLAHDRDFAVAAPALARLMRDRADVRLRLVGTVRVPAELRPLRDRISRLPTMSYGGYLREQARADISIAPLEAVEFNRYKSQVKYLEAGLLGRAFVASPTVYSDYVRAGETGLIATSPDDWYEHLRALADDETLRTRLGTAAREHVRTWSVPVTAPLEYRQLATDWPGV